MARSFLARHHSAWALLAVALMAIGCAARYEIAEGHRGAPGVERVLLLPLNFAIGNPAELDGAVKRVGIEQQAYLERHGKAVEKLPFMDAQKGWKATGRALGSEDVDPITSEFVRTLAKSRSFDAVVVGDVVSQEIRVQNGRSRWDGVSRPLRIVDRPRKQNGAAMQLDYTLKLPALSLRVQVYGPDGVRVFEGRGGLDLPHEMWFPDNTISDRWAIRMRTELLEDSAIAREGVELAFEPYLARPGDAP